MTADAWSAYATTPNSIAPMSGTRGSTTILSNSFAFLE